MPQPSESNPPLHADDSFFDLLVETLENVEESARGVFLQQFFKSIARIDLSSAQSLDYWTQILARRTELSESMGKRVSLRTAMVDVLAATSFLRVPILVEYEEFKKLQLNAATDSLTGLYNRRLFEEYCDKEFNRAKRYGQHLALVLLDLHRLKEVNDRYGHLRGDEVLQLAATILRKNLRASDFAFRIGGDEFALLLPQADPEQAVTLCDRLRANFESESAPMKLSTSVTIDYGIAVHPQDGDTKEILVRLADERLYQLKNAPRAEARPADVSKPAPSIRTEPVAPPLASKASAVSVGPFPASRETPKQPPRSERRKWERVSLAGTHAYAVISGNEKKNATVMDLCTGGLSFIVDNAEDLASPFFAVLHVPILPPLRVNLRKVHARKIENGRTQIGCAFVS
jgi:diguanylate cyclase (GGDEF)-like protein